MKTEDDLFKQVAVEELEHPESFYRKNRVLSRRVDIDLPSVQMRKTRTLLGFRSGSSRMGSPEKAAP
jgi:hypothetical protein